VIEFILQPWPWWFSGILIGLTVPALYFVANQAFGISTSLQHLGAICAPRTKLAYLRDHNWREGIWNLVFILGIALGSLVTVLFLTRSPIEFLPDQFHSGWGAVRLFVGGILVGFGTRYAGGCTSGHSITGLANLNLASLIATIFFFVGGLSVTWGLGSLIF
jgi:uncharacterized membrane protein YedE/YeeE